MHHTDHDLTIYKISTLLAGSNGMYSHLKYIYDPIYKKQVLHYNYNLFLINKTRVNIKLKPYLLK